MKKRTFEPFVFFGLFLYIYDYYLNAYFNHVGNSRWDTAKGYPIPRQKKTRIKTTNKLTPAPSRSTSASKKQLLLEVGGSVQDGTYALAKALMRSTVAFRSFHSVSRPRSTRSLCRKSFHFQCSGDPIRHTSASDSVGRSDRLLRQTSGAVQWNRSWNDFVGSLHTLPVATDRISRLSKKWMGALTLTCA